ncbi:MAG TPA: glycosyl transferase family 36 [bacterium]|nr:glycosyl transferase family 36 [bacterium]HQG45311.1 glycosyl transferase family 36 [bacterium]HQI47740.1 glycosyl transferase family 36 [bacterium]HQJ63877.1 glycosyl transferase family 36 [bacterium]
MKFATPYGHFSDDGLEYIITRPDTPKPWINVISNSDYGLIASQAGGGFSWRTHANFNRLTRWNQDLVRDEWGKFLYLRDRTSGALWSAAFQPVKNKACSYTIRHGLGYSVFSSRFDGITCDWTLFAAADDPAEIWILRLTNESGGAREIDLISYFEWNLGFAPDNHREFHKTFIETEFDPSAEILFAGKRLWEMTDEKGRHWNVNWPYTAFFASSEPVAGFEGDKEAFLGRLGDLRAPEAVQNGSCQNTQGKWGDAIASLQLRLDLARHESKSLTFVLGAADSMPQARELITRYRDPIRAQQELERVQKGWRERLAPFQVKTPDPAFDLLNNIWLKYQAISCRLWGRAAYYQQSGAYGFRDQLQDSLLWLPLDPGRTADQIRLHARHQFQDGSVWHWWHPYTEQGLHSAVSDNLLWLPFVVAEYLKESGEFALLQEQQPFVDDPVPQPLWEHCRRALKRGLAWRSDRGLPLIGAHDWNDGLNAVGTGMKGESIWMGHFLHRILCEWAEIAPRAGLQDELAFCSQAADQLRAAVEAYGWDGAWYWRATKDSGEKVGSAACAEGKIFLNAQTWAVIGGTASSERAAQAMQAVEAHLDREYGPILFSPAYTRVDPDIGYLSRYAPGRRENGGLYTHAGAWAVLAEALMGRGAQAYAMYCRINPILRGMDPDLYQSEPYVTPGNVDGPASPHFGRGGWSWYTGSAAWLFRAALEGILGLRAMHDGLMIDPCIPPAWETFTVRRRFRGADYQINVRNPHALEKGTLEIELDGQPFRERQADGRCLLPPFPPGTVHQVDVVMK